MRYLTKIILNNYLELVKIKLFGAEIILIYHQHKGFLFGIKSNHTILV